jgi:lipopolysaccharide heptosyltransferase II
MYRTNPLFWPFLLAIDVLGYIVLFWLKLVPFREPKKILLIRLEHIGDVLLTTPAFRALRRRFPKARIDVLVRDFSAPILKNNRNVDKVIIWNAPWLSLIGKHSSWASALRMIRTLCRNRYDLAIDFHGDPRTIVLASMVAHYRIGFGARGFGFLLNRVLPYCRQHVIDRNLSLAKALGADTRDRRMELQLTAQDTRFAQSVLKPFRGKRVVCISPGSGRDEKKWLNSRWAQVADTLIGKYGMRIVLTGSKREAPLIDDIISRIQHADSVLNLCGKTSLAQLAAIVHHCALVLSPDSGTMHIARAMNTPLIGLFTVENAREWGYAEPEFQHLMRPRAKDITAEMVLEKIKSVKCG